MELSYNDVHFNILTLDRVERHNVYTPDGTTLLWVEWNILASCVLAPATPIGPLGKTDIGGTALAVSTVLPTGRRTELPEGAPPVNDQGFTVGRNPLNRQLFEGSGGNPVFTDQEVLRRLAVPRRPLVISAYLQKAVNEEVNAAATPTKIKWLESPRNGLAADCNNGPFVKAFPVSSAVGNARLFACQLEINTCVPPTDADRLVLAHRWQMQLERSPEDYLIRIVTGEVTFHSGKLITEGVYPSWLIAQFLHPIPPGFRRRLGPITVAPAGNVLRYEYGDEDQSVVFSPGSSGATHVEVTVEAALHLPTLRTGL